VVEAKQMWESFRERETRGKKAAAIAAQHNINLTTSQHRSWYEATWMETVVNWTAVADLLDKVAPGWDAAGVPTCVEPQRWHELKTDPAVWDDVDAGRKTFEIRLNDRDYQPGDGLLLRKTRYTGWEMKEAGYPLEYIGAPLRRVVTHVLRGPVYGLAAGWAILSIKPCGVATCVSAQPVAWVPIHPRNGPLWSMTTDKPDPERLPGSYPLRPLAFADGVSTPDGGGHDGS
jgi:hypothetical protein